jgi:hypothetical protein
MESTPYEAPEPDRFLPSGSVAAIPRRAKPSPNSLDVRKEHLKDLGAIQDLLFTLNDPYAAGLDLSRHIENIPLLKARLLRAARIKTGHLDLDNLGSALMFLGNKGLEAELLQLLEDMTIAKFELG